MLKATPKGKFSHFVSFNVLTEVFRYINLPDCDLAKEEHERIPVNLDESVALMEIFETHTQIWVMEELEGIVQSWTKRYTINLQLLYRCLCLKMDGELFYVRKHGGVNCYNIKNQETKVLAKSYNFSPLFTSVYVESLALLKGNASNNVMELPTFILE